jgi:hypothetical protein
MFKASSQLRLIFSLLIVFITCSCKKSIQEMQGETVRKFVSQFEIDTSDVKYVYEPPDLIQGFVIINPADSLTYSVYLDNPKIKTVKFFKDLYSEKIYKVELVDMRQYKATP